MSRSTSLHFSATIASMVRRSPATDAAFWSAVRTTLVGSKLNHYPQAAQRLSDAAAIMAKEPIALQLRFLQTLVEIASENNSTTIFPVPIDILKPFLSTKGDRTA